MCKEDLPIIVPDFYRVDLKNPKPIIDALVGYRETLELEKRCQMTTGDVARDLIKKNPSLARALVDIATEACKNVTN